MPKLDRETALEMFLKNKNFVNELMERELGETFRQVDCSKVVDSLGKLQECANWSYFVQKHIRERNKIVEQMINNENDRGTKRAFLKASDIAMDEVFDLEGTLVKMDETIVTLDAVGAGSLVPKRFCPLTLRRLFSQGNNTARTYKTIRLRDRSERGMDGHPSSTDRNGQGRDGVPLRNLGSDGQADHLRNRSRRAR
jgi:hypothetical protein